MNFDLRTYESALNFLTEFTSVSESEIILHLLDVKFDMGEAKFCDVFRVDLDRLSVLDVKYIVSHVTTTNDNLKSIKQYGLRNLQEVLNSDTPLKNFLKTQGFLVDIGNRILRYGGKEFSIQCGGRDTIDRHSVEYALHSIGLKIYNDHQISAFLLMKDDTSYGGLVHERPEFLFNISKLCKFDIEKMWKCQSHPYVIEFRADFEQIEHYTFYRNVHEYNDDSADRTVLKEWLIDHAFQRTCNGLIKSSWSDIYAYIKPDAVISPEQFVNIRKIENVS